MNTTRLARVAREALLLLRQFMGKGDYYNAAEAALKAAEAFKEIAKHSSGSSHKVAYKRSKILVEITKVLRRGEPLPLELVEALDSFFPAPKPRLKVTTPDRADETKPTLTHSDEPSVISEELENGEPGEAQHELLNGLDIACKLTDMLNRAKDTIRIMVQNFTDVKTVTAGTESCEVNFLDRLVQKGEEGLSVRIIIREPEAFGGLGNHFREAVEQLLQRSPQIEILVCAQMHIKALIIDNSEVLEGSANFTAKGLSGIGEQATWTTNTAFVEQFVERFDQYWVHQSPECTACKNRTCEVHPFTRRL